MIRSFRHKGLKRLFKADEVRGVGAEHQERSRNILATLDAALTVEHMKLPGYRLHALRGGDRGIWAVTVRANWRVTFRFEKGEVLEVDYVDYH